MQSPIIEKGVKSNEKNEIETSGSQSSTEQLQYGQWSSASVMTPIRSHSPQSHQQQFAHVFALSSMASPHRLGECRL